MAALVAFGAAAAIALSLGARRARFAQRMLTIIDQAVLTAAALRENWLYCVAAEQPFRHGKVARNGQEKAETR